MKKTMNKMMVLLILFLGLSTHAIAKEYGYYQVKNILQQTQTKNETNYSINVEYLDTIIADLVAHARNYPPKFDSESDKARATKNVEMLSGMLAIITDSSQASPELLKRTSMINQIGHNLDIKGAAQKADRDYQKWIKLSPNDPFANFSYGAFLGGANQVKKAIPYLEKAVKANYTPAHFSLGMAYLTLQKNDLALKHFKTYQKAKPNDPNVKIIIEAIESGSVKFETQ